MNPNQREVFKNIKRCSYEIKKGSNGNTILSKCQSLAVKGTDYCFHHIKLFPEIYKSFVDKQQSIIINQRNNSPVLLKPSKYNFIRNNFSESYDEYYKHEGLIDLKNEIALLSATLNRLYSTDINSIDNMKVLDMQLKTINQIRMLIKTMRELDEGKKTTISFNDLKIFMLNVGQVIKNYVAEPETQKKIAQEVFNLYNTNKDIIDATLLSDSTKV